MLFTLERKTMLTAMPRNLLFFAVFVFFSYVKIMSIFFKSFDPFVPFENLTAAMFFGGIIDAIKKARKPAQPVGGPTVKGGAGAEMSKGASSTDADVKKSN